MPSRRYEPLASHVRFGSITDITVGLRKCPLYPQKRTSLSEFQDRVIVLSHKF